VSDDRTSELEAQLAVTHDRASAAEARVLALEGALRHARVWPWRAALVLISVGWAGVLSLGLAWGSFVVVADDLYCERTPGSSDYGDLGWSIVPPGPQCSWPGVDEVRGPTPVMSVWLGLLLVLGGLMVWAARRGRVPEVPDQQR
jgi:hypothetical protein